MLKMFLSLLIIMFSIMMFFFNHPLSMGWMILLQTFLTCSMSGMLINTYWFSYFLFLVFLGGLLVLFIYVSSNASNGMFSNNFFCKMILIFIFLMSILLSYMFMYNMNWLNFIKNYEMNNFLNLFIFFNNENKINLSKLYNNYSHLMMMMMIIYLFITVVAVVNITNIFFGPLRLSN
uniref:NADH-ubiquinone oxidoreductase chain 6 n=1 Tax=Parnassius imperator TaxID=213944 RepID=A0A0U1XIK1_9NEOP|nr:NADH dehydrogenase subunit 6 [Parnassius imperator]